MDGNGTNNGISFAGALFLLFLGLKLGHVINWSWWWVTAPLWGSIALFVGFLAIAAVIAMIVAVVVKD